MATLSVVGVLPGSTLETPHTALRQRSVEVDFEAIGADTIRQIVHDMLETLYSTPAGVGLAAPQVGILLRIVVIDLGYRGKGGQEPSVLINPRITDSSSDMVPGRESCLSVPGYFGDVERSKTIHVKALNQYNQEIEFDADGFYAKVIQHEVDHLDGILYPDRVSTELEREMAFPAQYADAALQKLYGGEAEASQEGAQETE